MFNFEIALNLFQVHNCMGHFGRAVSATIATNMSTSVVTRHDGLKDTRERSHADSRRNQHCVRSLEYVIRRGTVRSIKYNLECTVAELIKCFNIFNVFVIVLN